MGSADRDSMLEAPPARDIPPIVSAEWLGGQLGRDGLVVIDLRDPQEYLAGHIPGALNIPAASFVVARGGLLLELPDADDLFKLIGDAGLAKDSRVVLYNRVDHPYPRADTTRAAFTLIYGGVRNVALLDGGLDAWKARGYSVSDAAARPKAKPYASEIHPEMIVDKSYVEGRIGRSLIVDARDPQVYFGESVEPFAPKPGHIPTAVNIPTPWLWTAEGSYKAPAELAALTRAILGDDTSREIIVYCGVGGYGSTAWFVQREILGYKNVKLFDGSAQEWVMDEKAPLSTYRWD